MIPVSLADEERWSPLFDATVRRRGAVAIDRLLGKAVTAPGRKPKETFQSPEEIPPDRFPAYWTEVRPADGGSTLDDMMGDKNSNGLPPSSTVPRQARS